MGTVMAMTIIANAKKAKIDTVRILPRVQGLGPLAEESDDDALSGDFSTDIPFSAPDSGCVDRELGFAGAPNRLQIPLVLCCVSISAYVSHHAPASRRV